MEEDIKLLNSIGRWVSVVPHNKKWKAVVWKNGNKDWIEEKSRIHINPIKAYEWSAEIIYGILEKENPEEL